MASNKSTSPEASESQSGEFESETKRRKLRKGTSSCWACKKRKVRCTFDSSSDATCINCRRRGTTCLGQEVPEQEAAQDQVQIGDRIVRVEELLSQLVKDSRQNGHVSSSEKGGNRSFGPTTPFSDSDSTLYRARSQYSLVGHQTLDRKA
jgi:hypothetical protein